MNYGAHIHGPLDGDAKFKNIVMSILDFVDTQLFFKFHGVFKTRENYEKKRRDIEYQFEHPIARDKFVVLCDLEDMINYLPPPKVKKVVREYYDAQMTAYCNSMRGFSKEIPNYPYKSENIVDLLAEVEKVNKEKSEQVFSPKPFVFPCFGNEEFANSVYTPRRDIWIDNDGIRKCSCVHVCKQFLCYPVIKGGIRVIPENAICLYDSMHFCRGSNVCKNGIYSTEYHSIDHKPYLMRLKNNQR